MLRDSTRICVLRCGGERTGRLSCDSSEEHDVSSSSFSARAPPAAFDAERSTTVALETSASAADVLASVMPDVSGAGASAGAGRAGAARASVGADVGPGVAADLDRRDRRRAGTYASSEGTVGS